MNSTLEYKPLEIPGLIKYLNKWNNHIIKVINEIPYGMNKIKLEDLCRFTYKDARVGQAVSSMLLRLNESTSRSRLTSREEVLWHLQSVCRSIDTIEYLKKYFDIEQLHLSESVYHSYALVDYAIKNGITTPYFLTYEGPIFIEERHACKVDEIGSSPRQKATLEALVDTVQTDSETCWNQ